MPSRLTRQPGLDGVRAVAVIMVLLYHGGVSWAQGGFLGVDVFFVLSGYLITAIILSEVLGANTGVVGGGAVRLRAFWARRFRRVAPALAVLIAAVVVYAAVGARSIELVGLRGDTISAVFQVSNWHFALRGTSYFDALSPSLLQHTWSLAIEAQWYLLWPIVLLGLLRVCRNGTRRLAGAVALLACASAGTCAFLYAHGASDARLYYGTDTRVQALLVGALLAVVRPSILSWRERDGRGRVGRLLVLDALGTAGMVGLVAFLVVNPAHSFLYRGGLLLAAAAAGMVVLAASLPGVLTAMLSLRPLRAVGLISYSLYLWHWPIDLVVDEQRTAMHGAELLGLRTALAFAFATASYFLVEQPFRRWHPSAARRRWQMPSLTTAAAAALTVAIVFATTNAPAPQPANALPRLAVKSTPPPQGITRILLVGDSQMFSLVWWGAPLFHTKGVAWANGSTLGCGVLPDATGGDGCKDRDFNWNHDLEHFDPDLTVLWIGAWEALDFTVDGHTYVHGTPAHEHEVETLVTNAARVLMSRGSRLALLEVPCFGAAAADEAGLGDRADPAAVADVNHALRAVAARTAGVTFVPWSSLLCHDGHAIERIDGVDMRPDGVHTQSLDAARILFDDLEPRLVPLAQNAYAARHPVTPVAATGRDAARSPVSSSAPR